MRLVDVHNELEKLSFFSEAYSTAATATPCPTTANNNMPHKHKHSQIQIQHSQQHNKNKHKQKPQKKKTVSFGQVSIREYAVTIGGDSYKSRDTCPLTLDWAYFEDTNDDNNSDNNNNSCKVVKVVNTKTCQEYSRHNRFVQKCIRLSVQQRRQLVRKVNGLSWKDVDDLENDLVRQRRQQGYYNYDKNNANSSRIQEILHEPSALEVVMRDYYSSMPLYTDEQTNDSNHTSSFGSRDNVVSSNWKSRHSERLLPSKSSRPFSDIGGDKLPRQPLSSSALSSTKTMKTLSLNLADYRLVRKASPTKSNDSNTRSNDKDNGKLSRSPKYKRATVKIPRASRDDFPADMRWLESHA